MSDDTCQHVNTDRLLPCRLNHPDFRWDQGWMLRHTTPSPMWGNHPSSAKEEYFLRRSSPGKPRKQWVLYLCNDRGNASNSLTLCFFNSLKGHRCVDRPLFCSLSLVLRTKSTSANRTYENPTTEKMRNPCKSEWDIRGPSVRSYRCPKRNPRHVVSDGHSYTLRKNCDFLSNKSKIPVSRGRWCGSTNPDPKVLRLSTVTLDSLFTRRLL